ncbi:MAG: hypothetical protein GXO85_15510 [Chlorobi bacterium]|nr:hypothetical protein [Chlorobiota bacterium]
MTSILEDVQKILKIKNVVLRNSFVNIDNDIEPENLSKIDSTGQSFRGVSKVRETSFEDDEHEWWEYGFHYDVGVRLIRAEDEKNDKASPLVEIKAIFSAVYISEIQLTENQIEAFSENNVGYHVWPYWRELMQSSCMRLAIVPIEAPLYFCPST